MGYRLHVHKKHVIEYGKDDFNWRHDEINSLLHDTCSCCFNDEDFFENSTEIEVLRKDFKELYSEILKKQIFQFFFFRRIFEAKES
jgi:hypothetical protein